MIDEILAKIGIKSVDELREDERAVYRAWSEILAKPDTSIEDLKATLPKELDRAHAELRKLDNSEKRQMYYASYADHCLFMIRLISIPAQQREGLRATLRKKFNLE